MNDLFGSGNWFTVTREAAEFTLGNRTIRLRDISHIDYLYRAERLDSATLVLKRPTEDGLMGIHVGSDEAGIIKTLVEQLVLAARR